MDGQANEMTAADRQTFAEVGAVAVRGLIPPQWLDLLRDGLEEMKAAADDYSGYYDDGEVVTTSPDEKERPRKAGLTLVRQNAWVISAPMRRFLNESPVAQVAAHLLGSATVHLYEDLMIFKAAGAEQPTPWHQDSPQWPLRGRQMCSAWFCLDPVTSKTGALRFAAGSHNGPAYRPYVAPDRLADLERDAIHFDGGPLPDVEADPQRFPVVSYDTEPGDVVFFHPNLLHAAFGSAPDYPRRTFSIRFLGDDVRWLTKRSVMYAWLSKVALRDGDRIESENFPVLWPRQPLAT